MIGRKSVKKKVRFQDAEHKQCAVVVPPPDTKVITKLVKEYKEKCRDDKSIDQWTMWHMLLKMAKEFIKTSAKILILLDQVADLEEELNMDTTTTSETDMMIQLIDDMISECQDTILEAIAAGTPLPKWTRDTMCDIMADNILDAAVSMMNKVVESTVFKDIKKLLKTNYRCVLLDACCALFQASEILVKSVVGDGQHIALDEKLESMFEDAISKTDDQTLDYLDVDSENEEEEMEEED